VTHANQFCAARLPADRQPLPAPVSSIGRMVCWDAQRAVMFALAEKAGDNRAAYEVLEVIGLNFLLPDDVMRDAPAGDSLSLLWSAGIDSVLSTPEPRASRKTTS
jgi:hypothetical protein